MADDRPKIPESMIVYLLPALYAAAENAGFDMRFYRVIKPIPLEAK